jgi:hypothetical protein
LLIKLKQTVLFLVFTAMALNADQKKVEVDVGGYASMEGGQIVKGTYTGGKVLRSDHVWLQRMYGGLTLDAHFSPAISGKLALEMRMSNEYPRDYQDKGTTRRLYFYPYLHELDFNYAFGKDGTPFSGSLAIGYIPLKYNKDARNLGEYLFRSGTYPQYLVTDFDFAAYRIAGLNFQTNLTEGLVVNALAYTNIEWQAIGDLNLALLLSYNVKKIIEVGFGVNFSSLISADENFTALKNPGATDYIKSNGDTGYYTFAGTKLMGRLSFDPKKLFSLNVFGEEDLKIYGEAAILGVKNYPISTDSITDYSDIGKRIPVMFGINLPAFKLLDVLSLQAEWFGSRNPNDMSAVVFENSPLPMMGDKKRDYLKNRNTNMYKDDDWKWSVYAKRTIAERFTITAQVASDHLRWFCQDWTRQDFEEALRKSDQFYYVCKLGYSF